MICLGNAAPVADPAGASELYSIVDGLEEQLCCGAISAAVAAAMLIEECPADLK